MAEVGTLTFRREAEEVYLTDAAWAREILVSHELLECADERFMVADTYELRFTVANGRARYERVEEGERTSRYVLLEGTLQRSVTS